MNSRQDLILKWLKNIIWKHLTEWEREFVDGTWIEGIKLTVKQKIAIDDIYYKYRNRGIKYNYFFDEDDYLYIHDSDR